MKDKVVKPDDSWRKELSPEAYKVTRQKETEPPFRNRYYDHKAFGSYHCVCCGLELFLSEDKYDSGSGWPSFTAPLRQDRIRQAEDLSHGMRRIEILCARCDAHLGHLFADGPGPSGQRFCVNSGALIFSAREPSN